MKKALLIIVIVTVIIVLGFNALNSYIYNEKQGDPQPSPQISGTPQRQTLSGVVVCLPHKDTSGPQTLECATGIQTDSGEYYSLDTSLMSQTPPDYTNGQTIRAVGVVTPIENLSSDHWQKYDIVGIFSPTDSFEVVN